MLLNVCLAGLLGLASGPLQSLATARAVGHWNPTALEARDISALEDRDITARGFAWPTLQMKDISDQVARDRTQVVQVTGAEGKKVLKKNTVFVNTKKEVDQQLKVYSDIKGKGIGPELLAVIVDDNNKNEAIGFVQGQLEGPDTRKEDLDLCKTTLENLHKAGWLHMDPHRKNFKKVNGKCLVFDFEDSKRTSDRSAYEGRIDEEELGDDGERTTQDLLAQRINFESLFGKRTN
ncbi:hypothetical protein F4778DRAFT_766714 [Xylariomycetidae sp. FL2044]|nr:hypothetical protein F4778DRAFT_766714 [Xylariomycetidae sp. FL2044]